MTLVKGPNGLIIDVAASVASGLIGGGHVVAVDSAEVGEPEATSADQPEATSADEPPDGQGGQASPGAEVSDDDSDESPTEAPHRPGGNASKQDWYDYALAEGFAEEQLDGLKQSEIRSLFDE